MNARQQYRDQAIQTLCDEFTKYNHIDSSYYDRLEVKRGLRNSDGTGVLAGLTLICNVHGYLINEGERQPIDGELIYRGININDLVDVCRRTDLVMKKPYICCCLAHCRPKDNWSISVKSWQTTANCRQVLLTILL